MITKIVKTYFKFLKFLTSLKRKILRHLSRIVKRCVFSGVCCYVFIRVKHRVYYSLSFGLCSVHGQIITNHNTQQDAKNKEMEHNIKICHIYSNVWLIKQRRQ
jgi:hypothetical protein